MAENRKRKHSHSSKGNTRLSDGRRSHKIRQLGHGNTANNQSSGLREDSSESMRDWRQILCDTLRVPSDVKDDKLESILGATIEEATRDGVTLNSCASPAASSLSSSEEYPFYQVLHRVECSLSIPSSAVFNEEPFLLTNDDANIHSHLVGRDRISDVNKYIERNPGISFVTIRDYLCCKSFKNVNPIDQLHPVGESVIIVSPELCNALNRFRDTIPNGHMVFDEFRPGTERTRLFFLLYHHIEKLADAFITADEKAHKHQKIFLDYIQQHKAIEYENVAKCLDKGVISAEHFQYLLVPGDVYILKNQQGADHARGVQMSAQPKVNMSWTDRPTSADSKLSDQKIFIDVELHYHVWDFDGSFQRTPAAQVFRIVWDMKSVCSLSGLPFCPFTYAKEETRKILMRRGDMFWKCRFAKYVSYNGWDPVDQKRCANSRFMVDYRSHRAVSQSQYQSTQTASLRDDLGQEATNNERPPSDTFLLTLPVVLPSFSLDDKRWRQLLVSQMSDVVWDDKAFQSLVVPDDTKDVIRALVTHRVASPLSPDIIRGKGSGLILLLHGPPGTGKTLTAESVAEYSRKPLFRVTCGDIGTKPEAVEKYLSGVLRLARVWDCVVLLDEAEVFLQERSLTDLGRNALVSVFLRVLEYHDGILILTSNRVGTLDEGFRSRIQLALEYPKLDSDSRRRVWGNFIERLESNPEESADVNLSDLRQNLSRLSNYELNGREIRNAINVARPLALSTGAQVDFKCLQKVIGVQRRFLRYIEDVNEGLDAEKVAREEGKR